MHELGTVFYVIKEVEKLCAEDPMAEVNCQFCDKIYDYTPDQVRQILKDLDG